ncbi:MAG TPA: hypothetical protein VI479_19040 [Blastocatellia bacterium]
MSAIGLTMVVTLMFEQNLIIHYTAESLVKIERKKAAVQGNLNGGFPFSAQRICIDRRGLRNSEGSARRIHSDTNDRLTGLQEINRLLDFWGAFRLGIGAKRIILTIRLV